MIDRLLSTLALAMVAIAAEPSKPRVLATLDYLPRIVKLADESFSGFFLQTVSGRPTVMIISSRDGGETWTPPMGLLALSTDAGGWLGPDVLAGADGEVHLFLLNDANSGVVKTGEDQRQRIDKVRDKRLDIWHLKSSGGRKQWPQPRRIWTGYTGSLNSVLQLQSGRILLPFSYLTKRTWRNRGEGLEAFTFYGQYNSSVIYSDNEGASWQIAPAQLKVPVPDIVSAYGGVEPVAVELNDHRVWMLIRTQQGRFYESFSDDGIHWGAPVASRILSSDSPAGLVRLHDKRLVLLWNNCLRFPYAYGGRHVLHAAISEDDGKSWSGYREVAQDPLRALPPPAGGDHGTAYPYPLEGTNGRILFSTGQGPGRHLVVSFDPQWLYSVHHRDDFTAGVDGWSTFGTRGVKLDEDKKLVIRKTDEEWPAAAVWNFPNAVKGRLTLKLKPEANFGSATILLTDHYSVPFDLEDRLYALYQLQLRESSDFPPGQTSELSFDWDLKTRACLVTLNRRHLARLPLERSSEGVNYLRLRAEQGGFAIQSVEATADQKP